MAQSDVLKRYLDAGLAFTQMTRERAEEIVSELVKAGDARRRNTEELIEDLVERSRKNTEELVKLIRREVTEQLRSLGLDDLVRRAGGSAGSPAASNAPAPEAGAAAPLAAAAKAVAKKATPAKKSTGGAPKKAAPAAGGVKAAKKATKTAKATKGAKKA